MTLLSGNAGILNRVDEYYTNVAIFPLKTKKQQRLFAVFSDPTGGSLALELATVGNDHVLVDAQRDVAVHLDEQRRLLDLLDRTVDDAGGGDPFPLLCPLARCPHPVSALVLRAPHEEPPPGGHYGE